VVETRREGYYVLYSLSKRRLSAVAPLLGDFLKS
jgi:hypothetical protein